MCEQAQELRKEIDVLKAALDQAVSYIMLDSEYPKEVTEWAVLAHEG